MYIKTYIHIRTFIHFFFLLNRTKVCHLVFEKHFNEYSWLWMYTPPHVTFCGMMPNFFLIAPFISWLSDCLWRRRMWRCTWRAGGFKHSQTCEAANKRAQGCHTTGSPHRCGLEPEMWRSLPVPAWGCCRSSRHWCSGIKWIVRKLFPVFTTAATDKLFWPIIDYAVHIPKCFCV